MNFQWHFPTEFHWKCPVVFQWLVSYLMFRCLLCCLSCSAYFYVEIKFLSSLRKCIRSIYCQLLKLNLEEWAQPLGDLNFQKACWSESKQWFWDLRPSICCFWIEIVRTDRTQQSFKRLAWNASRRLHHQCIWAVIFIPIPLPRKVIQTSCCTHMLLKSVIQTGLGMGMGMNRTAQWRTYNIL